MPHPISHPSTLRHALDTIDRQDYGAISLGSGLRLARGRTHEIQGDGADVFILAAATRLTGSVVWIGGPRAIGTLDPAGLQEFIDPTRLMLVESIGRDETLWACEQALRMPGAACIVVELDAGPKLKESRRLQLAAEETGSIGLIRIYGTAHTSVAETRWECHAVPTTTTTPPTNWLWHCVKNRRGNPGRWHAGWIEPTGADDGTSSVHLVAATAA